MAASSGKGKHRPKNRKTKTFLEFDEKLRQEYLRGFQKRKNERRKLAREKHDKKILEERKLLLKQARESKASSKTSALQLPEIEQLVKPEVFDLPEHTVTISNISEVDFVGKSGLRLGQNTGFGNKGDNESSEEEEEKEPEQPLGKKSLQHQLAHCSNQLSSQKQKVKKMKKKQMLRQKLQSKKKGRKKGKGKKK
ncbi:hypothetical protein EGW08_003761 [Elysia chlorotica]|uniref:Nucleolar protein 12 n=1 Tax=Elysia chlorotica TaxID=188477 RepID=A0A433U3X4_ELYCH|nr:hypothetical protein EGW08_003761 [Elysia chlorotica]